MRQFAPRRGAGHCIRLLRATELTGHPSLSLSLCVSLSLSLSLSLYLYLYLYPEIYSKESAQAMMETKKSEDLHLASWRPTKAGVTVPV